MYLSVNTLTIYQIYNSLLKKYTYIRMHGYIHTDDWLISIPYLFLITVLLAQFIPLLSLYSTWHV